MTAPLYEVKRKFSRYVKLAEQGETIYVTKYGKPVVIVVSQETFEEQEEKKPSFMEAYMNWRKNCEDLSDETPWDNIRSKEIYKEKNIWDD